MKSIQKRFELLAAQAAGCSRCQRMACKSAVLGRANGPITASIIFIAEAPGRLGAGRTGVPFQGDQSGKNFETLLASIGMTRKEVFITNAVLCNPLENAKNARPKSSEIRNCSSFLKSTLDLVKPRIVVTLGGVALEAMNQLFHTKHQLALIATQPQKTLEFTLLPLYHPSPRVANWKRPLEQQKRDFKKILSLKSKILLKEKIYQAS